MTFWKRHSLTCLSGRVYLIFKPFSSFSRVRPYLSPSHWAL